MHPWLLTGPWYRWDEPGEPSSGRQSRPALQKYASGKFVNEFLAEPQRSLKYKDEDCISQLVAGTGGASWALQRTDVRKIFLTTHERFYLVVVELHCDAPGLPAVAPDQVRGAGFVVRRVRAAVPEQARAAASESLATLRTAEARLTMAERRTAVRARTAAGALLQRALRGSLRQRRVRLLESYLDGHAQLDELVAEHAISLVTEGWFPAQAPGAGAWQVVEDTPTDLAGEAVFPLYPLIPDPRAPRHSARGRGLWFGVLPTGGSETTVTGTPRFDDQHVYEVRCFVRRREPGYCKDELFWSLPTQGYRLASHFDLDGTSHRQVTVQFPDLRVLEAQVRSMPSAPNPNPGPGPGPGPGPNPGPGMGAGMGLRVFTPPESELMFQTSPESGSVQINGPQVGGGGGSFCFFAIPLITIVAFFVLRLFMPIVVFLFGLWFLLRLKFCILPAFDLEAELAIKLKAGGSPDPVLDAQVENQVVAAFNRGFGPGSASKLLGPGLLSKHERRQLALALATDFSDSLSPDEKALLPETRKPGMAGPDLVGAPLPQPNALLEYYEILEMPS